MANTEYIKNFLNKWQDITGTSVDDIDKIDDEYAKLRLRGFYDTVIELVKDNESCQFNVIEEDANYNNTVEVSFSNENQFKDAMYELMSELNKSYFACEPNLSKVLRQCIN